MCSWHDEYRGSAGTERLAKVGKSATCSFDEELDNPDPRGIEFKSSLDLFGSSGSAEFRGFMINDALAEGFSSSESKNIDCGSRVLCFSALFSLCTVLRKRRFWNLIWKY